MDKGIISKEEPQVSEDQEVGEFKRLLTPANPIITKIVDVMDERAGLKVQIYKKLQASSIRRKKLEQQNEKKEYYQQSQKIVVCHQPEQYLQQLTLLNAYDQHNLIFKKYINKGCNRRGGKTYYASIFISLEIGKTMKLPEYKGMIVDNQLEFDANYESSNLMAVYKVSENSYDLILQNDINTSGFTQWFNFKVRNRRKNNFIAKFNIVNLYKAKSLYNMGMKPIVRSQKSDNNNKKTWRRKGYKIYYDKNSIGYESDPKKCYKTLTFQYDFTVQNDTVLFAHAMPYDLNDLQRVITNASSNSKVTIKQVGMTAGGRIIPVIHLKSDEKQNKLEKKAIVVLARQHPGETPGSYIAEQLINQLLRISTEVSFLLWKFDFYIFPMVNIDGVAVGNYRGNLYGFDLNRCWQKTDKIRQPEVYAIKNYIKKIVKKQNVELILDLHGHSRKMGSFFYGNTFGKNPILFPYIASKANLNVIFDDCRFSKQKASKAETARVVLGLLVKDTGNVYTYQTSFFGGHKNGNPFSFTEEHYKQLGKSLVLSMYRTYMEQYKQEKTLKQSLYLRQIKKEINQYSDSVFSIEQSGSDSQAQQILKDQIIQIDDFFNSQAQGNSISKSEEFQEVEQMSENLHKSSLSSKENGSRQTKDLRDLIGLPLERHNIQIKKKINELLQKSFADEMNQIIAPRLPNISKQGKGKFENQNLKETQSYNEKYAERLKKHKYYAQRLKVCGQTFQLRTRNQSNLDMSKQLNNKLQDKGQSVVKDLLFSKQIYGTLSPQTLQINKKQSHYLVKSLNTIALGQYKDQQTLVLDRSDLKHNRRRFKHTSLVPKEIVPTLNQQMINDVVKVNRLEYQKIKRESSNKKMSNANNSKEMPKGFKLPII